MIVPLQVKGDSIRRRIEAQYDELHDLLCELDCYSGLHQQEQETAPRRMEELQGLVRQQEEKERLLQGRYEGLIMEREKLLREKWERAQPGGSSNGVAQESEAVPMETDA